MLDRIIDNIEPALIKAFGLLDLDWLYGFFEYLITEGYTEEEAYLVFNKRYMLENKGVMFSKEKWNDIKTNFKFFANALEIAKLSKKNKLLKAAEKVMIADGKMNTALFLAFMKNEHGWDIDKGEVKITEPITFKIIDTSQTEKK